ncbi:MAG: TIGR03067 domain-containing protein [Planctomycetota bacterium]
MTHHIKLSRILSGCTAAVLGLLVCCAAEEGTGQKEPSLEGNWSVVSVELAGQKLEGLAGAELSLSKGKKTFKLPSGAVEKGAYTLDATANPKQIDATTEGKDGTEKGIYILENGILKMCLPTQGGSRPKTFATQKGTDLILIVLKPAPANQGLDAPVSSDKPTGERSFRMGFTGFVYDTTLEAVTASRKFCRENGDILAHHIEGVPWTEALNGQPFPKALLEEWEGKKSATPPKGKVYLAVSPGRGELKVADKAGPLPKELIGKSYDDPLVMKAYLNYCRRALEFFQPDYLAIGIEVNEIHRDGGPKKWNAYVALHQHVYKELKQDHKNLPIFASWTLHQMFQARGKMLDDFQKLMPHNDVVAVSYYPFFVGEKDRLVALDWMTEQFDAFKKPYAMVETNDSAERLPLPQAKVVLEGTPTKQAAYYRRLLVTAQKHDFLFVISFVHQDYDALWDKIKSSAPELFMAWRDCGLLDESGKARPSYEVWKNYFDLPLQKQVK